MTVVPHSHSVMRAMLHSLLSILYLGISSPNSATSSTGRMLDGLAGWLAGMGRSGLKGVYMCMYVWEHQSSQ